MNIQFGTLVFHKKSDEFSDKERENFLLDVRKFFNEKGFELDEYEFLELSKEEYPISSCNRCGYLTLDRNVNPDDFNIKGICEAISRIVHLGSIVNGKYMCKECMDSLGIS